MRRCAASGRWLPERTRATVPSGIGLVVLAVGAQSSLATRNAVFPVVSVAVGGLVGDALRIEDRLAQLGEALRRRFAAGWRGAPSWGFVTASLTFCIRPLTILGIGPRLLDVKRVPVASFLPAPVLAPVLVGLFAR